MFLILYRAVFSLLNVCGILFIYISRIFFDATDPQFFVYLESLSLRLCTSAGWKRVDSPCLCLCQCWGTHLLEGLVVHPSVAQVVVLQVQLPQFGQAVECSLRNLLQLIVLKNITGESRPHYTILTITVSFICLVIFNCCHAFPVFVPCFALPCIHCALRGALLAATQFCALPLSGACAGQEGGSWERI